MEKSTKVVYSIAAGFLMLCVFGIWNNSGRYVSVYNQGVVIKLHFTHLTNVDVMTNDNGSQTLFVSGVNYFMASADSIRIN